jgi:hypothetical protein
MPSQAGLFNCATVDELPSSDDEAALANIR